MGAGDGALARMRRTLQRHGRGGWLRAVFARPGGTDERVIDGPGTGSPAAEDAIAALLAAATAAAKDGLVKQTLVLDERRRVQVDARHGAGKLVERDDATLDKQMGGKQRALRPDTSAELLRVVGIMNADGTISAKHAKKYKQVSHFVELCRPIWDALRLRREPGAPVRVLDLGCGNGVLTFVIAEALRLQGLPARIVGVDLREDVIARAQARAEQLGWDELRFVRTAIADVADARALLEGTPDLVVALHACDTATDDALALAIAADVPAILAAPCCQHELAAQLGPAAVPIPAMARHGLLRNDYAATLTDAVRVEALAACGYGVDLLEFVADTHTPKNLLIRALSRDGRSTDRADLDALARRCDALGVRPRLLQLLSALR